ncbi:long-chain acyl-CoA synthetase [Limimonas halophila]|uniref:Long-chain acyl-CoA synthetase n=1 Tax=Limimonas halophila TaxID=1082479 RepID=A0A1G7LQW6_9PROT|nr:long-chain fatty acid--CoA ligase [Limimonas halophila]SDF51369.1 long-chain acyl-CoA synthetase [Limimonas halophila]
MADAHAGDKAATRTQDAGADTPVQPAGEWPNLPAAFFDLAHRHGERPFLWSRRGGQWTPSSWTEIARQVRALTHGLIRLGLEPGERVVLVADNRPAFFVADMAIMTAGAVTVPAYTTNTRADHEHVLADSGAALAIVATPQLGERLLPAAASVESCRRAILIDNPDKAPADAPPLSAWADVMADGAKDDDGAAPGTPAAPDDTACFIYTSGTGGAPKGVMLSHANVLANCRMAETLLKPVLDDEIFLSFLPLSHSYEHTAGQFLPMILGAQIYYSRGVEHLASEMTEVRPTMMTAVPRLYESMHQRIRRGVRKGSRLQRLLFQRALQLGKQRYRHGRLPLWLRPADALLDRLVRDKVRARFGGRLKGMVSGGAPLDPEIGLFFTALGLRILQGYGQTEASPVVACNPPAKPKLHTVGPPLDGCEVRIAEDGEILVRGPNVMKGYWRLPEETARTVHDGWLYTGDIGGFDHEGYLMVTDRKKDIVVLSGGDTLSPARVENVLTRQPEVAQAMVHGDGRPHLVALLVPDETFLQQWAAANGKPHDLASLHDDPALADALETAVQRVNGELSVSEKVRRFAIPPEAFTIDNDLLTPTMKIRRHKIRAAYGTLLEQLY